MKNVFETKMKRSIYNDSIFRSSNNSAFGEYFTSLRTTKLLDRYSWCADNINKNVNIACYLAQKDLFNTERQLKKKTTEASKKKRDFDDKWKTLSENQQRFRETFLDFNKFVIENSEKKIRAARKIEHNNKLLNRIVKQTTDLQVELEQLEEIKNYLDESIANRKIYENFLLRVVEKYPNQFTSVLDIIERYEALLLARKELSEMQTNAFNRYDAARSEFDDIIRKKQVKIAGLNNKLSELHKRYEESQQTSRKWDSIHHSVNIGTISKLRETEKVKQSCKQIYRNICERKGIPPVHENDYAKQFEIIKKCLLKFKMVNEMVKDLEKENLKLSEKACHSKSST